MACGKTSQGLTHLSISPVGRALARYVCGGWGYWSRGLIYSVEFWSRWWQVVAKLVRISQMRLPRNVLLPQDSLRAMTAGRNA